MQADLSVEPSAGIETVIDVFFKAWNDNQPGVIAGLFSARGRVHVRSVVILGAGNAAVRDIFSLLRASMYGGHLTASTIDAMYIGERSRLARVRWLMSGTAHDAPVFCGRFTLLLDWLEDRWQITAMDLEDLADLSAQPIQRTAFPVPV